MLSVWFNRDSRNRLSSFFGSGHVEIPETSSDEYSLVCAAVSAILQAARLGLERVAAVPIVVHQERGDLRVEIPEARRDEAATQAIVETAELAVEQIASQYPQHIRFERRSDPRP